MTAAREAPANLLLFYDDGCGVCAWIALRVLRSAPAGSLRLAAIGSPEGDARLGDLGERERWASWHLIDEHGRLHSGGAAFPVLLRALPRLGWLAALVESAPRLTDRAYRAMAATRSTWGRAVPRGAVRRARHQLRIDQPTGRGAQCRSR